MKKIFQITVLFISLVLGSFLFSGDAAAAEDNGSEVIMQPMFTYVNAFNNSFYIFEDGEACLDSYLSFRDSDMATINMFLERYENGSWVRIKSWTSTGYNSYVDLSGSWYVPSGYQYRMRAYGYVYHSGLMMESVSYTSDPFYY